MEISIKAVSLFIAIILTGLSAGLFCGWEVSVIPGTRRVGDNVYIETMQAINRAIINPAFMVIFFGTFLMQGLSAYQFRGTPLFWWILGATLIYIVGTLGITIFGNVPLNDSLDVVTLCDLSQEEVSTTRGAYQRKWNKLHALRTLFAVISFMLLQLGAYFHSQS